MHALDLPAGVITEIEDEACDLTDEISSVLRGDASEESGPDARDQTRERLAGPFRPIFISSEPQIDAFRILCARLREPDDGGPPNVGVIHVTEGADQAQLASELEHAESKAGVEALPLVVISPQAELSPEPGLVAGRRYERLPCPVTLDRILGAVRSVLGRVPEGVVESALPGRAGLAKSA